MTAEEILKDHKHLLHGYYVFEPEELQKFISQLCKEQRELCAEAIQEKNYYSNIHGEVYKEIINAPQPEVFGGDK